MAGSRTDKKYRILKWRSLQFKLTAPLLAAVAATFLAILLACIFYYKNAYWEREVSSQRKQMDRVVYGISTMQSTVENVSRQIVVSQLVQKDIRYPVKPTADYLIAADNIRSALGTYTFIMDYIQEILIYTEDGNTYSSFDFRDRFDPAQETWYQEFKAAGKNKGYTSVHMETVAQNGNQAEVISYVLTYYSLSDYSQELGDLIINLDYSSIGKMATLDMPLLQGYAVYNEVGERLTGKGQLGKSFHDIENIGSEPFEDEEGNIYLVSKELGSGWIMAVEISGRLMQRQILFMEFLIVFAFVVLALLIVMALSMNIKKVVEPINRLSMAAQQFGQGHFDVSVEVGTGDEVEVLAEAFNKMVKDIRHYTEMSVEYERMLRKSQVDQLLLQINPHFIYNTLNSIVYMARMEGNRDIEKFVNAFISLLQSTLRVENNIYTSLGEEIRNVENYLLLQKYRYMDQFEEEIRCPENLKEYLVPKVILQPVVENAIFHGIAPMEEKGRLIVSVDVIRDRLRIRIEDNGIGMPEDRIRYLLDEEHVDRGGMRKIGIANVNRRIREICGEEYGLRIESREGIGTRVAMELPLAEGQETYLEQSDQEKNKELIHCNQKKNRELNT